MTTYNPENQPYASLPPVEEDASLNPLNPDAKQQGSERNPEYTNNAQTQQSPPNPIAAAQQTTPVDPRSSNKPQTTAAPANNNDDSSMPQLADDADLIEKEWVEKAKSIIEQTKNDPRKQTEELSKVKNAYVDKRFQRNHRIKVDGEG